MKPLQSSKAKRWTLQGLLAASVVGLGIAGVMTQVDSSNPVEASQVDPGPPADGLSLDTYREIQKLRRNNGLTTEDLAALGLDQAEATAVLTRLVDWHGANEQALSESWQAFQQAESDLHELERLARTGLATTQDLAGGDQKIKALADAKKAQDALFATGSAHAMQAVPTKSAAWSNANGLKARASLELRHIGGMDASRIDFLTSESERLGISLEQVLSASEAQELAAVRSRISAQKPAIEAAEATALALAVQQVIE